MRNKDFQTIHEIGYTSLLGKLGKFRGAQRKEIHSGQESSAIIQLDHQKSETLELTASGIFLEGVHFDLTYTPLKHLGYKLMTAVSSKIYAMNGAPVLARIDIAVPNKISVAMTETIFSGFDRAGRDYQCAITPGDVTASQQGLVVSVHIIGIVNQDDIVRRNGCTPGDQVCVTGDLGGAMAGLRILLQEKKFWEESKTEQFQPDLQSYEYVIQRQLVPVSRYDFQHALSSAGVKPTSMIELGKGLLNELQLIAESNRIGCEIFTPAVPVDLETRKVADELKEDVDRYAFYGGEDYEILFTMENEDVEVLRSEFEDFSVIGEIKSESKGILLNTGEGEPVHINSHN